MTICHAPQREEKDPRTSHLPSDLNPSSPMLQGVIFHIFIVQFIFSSQTFQPIVFNQALKSKLKFTFLSQLQNHLHEENPSLSSTLEPLYCSSYATGLCSPRRGTPFQVQVRCRRLTRIQDRTYEESRLVALILYNMY